MKNNGLDFNWNSDDIDEHRRGITDIQWARMQDKGPPNYHLGDKVKFMAGGIGVITAINEPQSGWPSSYSIDEIKGFKFHPKAWIAWHYEGDIQKITDDSEMEEFKKDEL